MKNLILLATIALTTIACNGSNGPVETTTTTEGITKVVQRISHFSDVTCEESETETLITKCEDKNEDRPYIRKNIFEGTTCDLEDVTQVDVECFEYENKVAALSWNSKMWVHNTPFLQDGDDQRWSKVIFSGSDYDASGIQSTRYDYSNSNGRFWGITDIVIHNDGRVEAFKKDFRGWTLTNEEKIDGELIIADNGLITLYLDHEIVRLEFDGNL